MKIDICFLLLENIFSRTHGRILNEKMINSNNVRQSYEYYFRMIKKIMQITRSIGFKFLSALPIRESLLRPTKCDTSRRIVARGNSITC